MVPEYVRIIRKVLLIVDSDRTAPMLVIQPGYSRIADIIRQVLP
ncbi:hypothetical protein EPIR_2391 [Erwinia piriflorinigrans CFBP 5888]|uniref:Uncharacterized protein n=1 Tax=Erwinia piriflorinigrans CFBP 5888 TaxID=1161919 RepID=V5Z9Q4_9GAMM|nr:hypothetical protein EPIR_2391 [Erwinia piriflorinigrans CFBP 5888]